MVCSQVQVQVQVQVQLASRWLLQARVQQPAWFLQAHVSHLRHVFHRPCRCCRPL